MLSAIPERDHDGHAALLGSLVNEAHGTQLHNTSVSKADPALGLAARRRPKIAAQAGVASGGSLRILRAAGGILAFSVAGSPNPCPPAEGVMAAGPDERRLLELRREVWRRRCQRDFTAFAVHALSPRGESPARHHRAIIAGLERVARGECSRLLLLMPPGSGKTTYTSRLFPAWYFASRPGTSIIAASLTAELAELNSAHVQRFIRDNADVVDYGLRNDARAHWETDNDCRYRAIGAGGAITRLRADLVIIAFFGESCASGGGEIEGHSGLLGWSHR
jgi:hypothetical protein